jgi:hypothetical protein
VAKRARIAGLASALPEEFAGHVGRVWSGEQGLMSVWRPQTRANAGVPGGPGEGGFDETADGRENSTGQRLTWWASWPVEARAGHRTRHGAGATARRWYVEAAAAHMAPGMLARVRGCHRCGRGETELGARSCWFPLSRDGFGPVSEEGRADAQG